MSDWTQAEVHGQRIRWKHDGEEHARLGSGYTLEKWHDGRKEWREVLNWNSRDWFVTGLLAARSGAQTEMAL